MIIRARSLLTMDGPPIDNGAVAISGNVIADVGTYADVRQRNGGEVLDLGERVLLPGLINAHCHLDYTSLRGTIPRPSSFTVWIRAINEHKAALTEEDYLQSITAGFLEAVGFGTTTLANLEAFPGLLPRLPPPPIRTWWFAEMIDVRDSVSASDLYEQMRRDLAGSADQRGGIGLAPHAPFTASAALYREAAAVAAEHDLPLGTHLAESDEEMQMFSDRTGSLFEFMSSIGRSMNDCGKTTPLARMIQQQLLDDRWIVAHLNELTEDDFRLLESAPKFHVVHCPRSHEYFGHAAFPLERLRRLGFNIALGTDSLASSPDLSLFREMRQMARAQPSLSPRQLLEMGTVRPAAALRQQGSLGRLRSGFKADLIAVASATTGDRLFEEVVAFDGKVPWSMVDGAQPAGI